MNEHKLQTIANQYESAMTASREACAAYVRAQSETYRLSELYWAAYREMYADRLRITNSTEKSD